MGTLLTFSNARSAFVTAASAKFSDSAWLRGLPAIAARSHGQRPLRASDSTTTEYGGGSLADEAPRGRSCQVLPPGLPHLLGGPPRRAMSLHSLVHTTILLVLCYYVLVPYYLLVFALLFAIQGFRMYRERQRVTPPGPVLITGCDTGFGEMTSLRLDSQGVRVFAACLTQEGADRLKARASDRLVAFVMDVTKDEDVKAAAQRIAASGVGLWGVINNAGITAGLGIELLSFPAFQQCMDVNFYGAVRVTRAMLPFLKKNRGRIINIASVAGRIGMAGAMPYSASKCAFCYPFKYVDYPRRYCMEAFSDALRREVRVWGIDVVCIEPGYFNTPILANLDKRFDPLIAQVPADLRAEYGDKYFEVRTRTR